jgi:lipopolysaccharide biosynthesis regulator YciM
MDLGDSAYHHFLEAYRIDPTHSVVNYNLGMINYTSSFDSEAIYHFKKAIKNSETLDFDSYEMLTEVYNQLGRYDSAETIAKTLVEQAKQTKGDTIRSKLILAYTYGDMGKADQLVDILSRLIHTGISDREHEQMAYYNRYLGYYLLDNKEKACEDFLKLGELDVQFKVEVYFECGDGKKR